MNTWHIDTARAAPPVPAGAVECLLDAPQHPEPAARMLSFLNAVVPVDYLSLVEYVRGDGKGGAPELVEGHARPGLSNVTPACFAHYRLHFWREDQGTRIAERVARAPSAGVAALHFRIDDIPIASWRSEIYDRAQLSDRLSFFYAPQPGATFAINLYRDRAHGGFGPAEIDTLLGLSPLLRLTHRIALGSRPQAEPLDRPAIEVRVERAHSALRRRAPELSPRELAVCARIACGISAEGIAAELDIAPSTVMTLRKRAYAKLSARQLGGGRLKLAELAL